MSGSTRINDHRSPLVFDTHELRRQPGAMKTIERVIPAPPELGLAMIKVPEQSDIDLVLTLCSVGEGVLVTGNAQAELVGECARCLTELSQSADFDFEELYFYPGHAEEEDDLEITDEQLDIEPVLREAVVLGLPFTPLCQDDCAGLCSQCGANLNEHPDHSHEADIDPRWAKLAGFNPQ